MGRRLRDISSHQSYHDNGREAPSRGYQCNPWSSVVLATTHTDVPYTQLIYPTQGISINFGYDPTGAIYDQGFIFKYTHYDLYTEYTWIKPLL